MNKDEFLAVMAWDNVDLWNYCKELTKEFGHVAAVKMIMDFRRESQIGLSRYSKGRNSMDAIQNRAVWMIEMIAKWCGSYYKQWARNSVLKTMPDLAKNPRKLKGFVNNAWEQYVRKASY